MHAGGSQVLALRLARHGLAAPAAAPPDVLASWTVQDSPPGAAVAALAARVRPLAPGALDAALAERSAVALYSPRTALAVLPAADAAAFGAALEPSGDAELEAVLNHAVPDRTEGFGPPVDVAVAAIADALDGRELSRDELHEELRRRLPADLLPWCAGCGSHHARRGLLVLAGLRGRLCVAGRAGRQPRFARTDQWIGWDPPDRAEARAGYVRRYLRAYGPSTPAHLAEWAGVGRAQAREAWALVAGELEEVRVEGAGRAWLPAADVPALEDPPAAEGVRLLAPGDPLLLARDRALLVPDPEVRARVWRATGGAGVVLAAGGAAALWRGRKEGRRLAVTVEPMNGSLDLAAVEAEAERLAPHRGCTSASVSLAA